MCVFLSVFELRKKKKKKMAVSKFEYPRLSRGEIAAILAQSQIANVTEHDLINPNPDFISELYTRILIHLQFFLQLLQVYSI